MTPSQKPTRTQVGKGTSFLPIEKGLNNGKFACGGGDWVDPDLPVCASRSLPCYAWVRIENIRTGDQAWCKIMDRGPYGKFDSSGEWFNSRKEENLGREGKYRSIVDMSRSVSKTLGSKGLIRVRIKYWKNNPYQGILDSIYFNSN